MNETLRYTVKEIYRLADEYQKDVAHYGFKTIYDVFDFIKRIPYVRDRDRLNDGSEEVVQRPGYSISGGGDCDDKTIIAGAAFNLLEVPWRVVTISYDSSGDMQHVYPEIFVDGNWRPFDATYPTNKIFYQPKYTHKIVWDNPMMTRKLGVVTLEGDMGYSRRYVRHPGMGYTRRMTHLQGLGQFDPVSALSIGTGVISKIGSIVQQIPLLGSIFRGTTQHVSNTDARAKELEIWNEAVNLYDSLDATGKTLLWQKASYFFNGWILSPNGWGTWWGGFITNELTKEKAGPNWNSQRYQIGWFMGFPMYAFLTQTDMETVQDFVAKNYSLPTKTIVWDPINAYISSHIGSTSSASSQSSSANQATSTTQLATLFSGNSGIALIVGAGLLFGLLSSK